MCWRASSARALPPTRDSGVAAQAEAAVVGSMAEAQRVAATTAEAQQRLEALVAEEQAARAQLRACGEELREAQRQHAEEAEVRASATRAALLWRGMSMDGFKSGCM